MYVANVLIVDDDRLSRETLTDLLSTENCQLQTAECGAEALSLARSHRPDLILLDVMMPNMSGYDVCEAVRKDPQLAEVPVVLVTALDDPQSRLQGLEAGADDFISKPYDRSELRARVRTVLKLNRFRRLLAERSKFAWVVDNSRDGYVLLDQQGGISYVNAQARAYLHIADNPEGQNFLAQVQRHYHCRPEEAWQQWPSQTPAALYLVRPDSPEMKGLWLHVECFAVDSGDQHETAVCLSDVTAQFNITQQVWSFHGLISHKLRTPLTGLKAVQLIKKHVEKALPDDKNLLQLINMIDQSASRLETHLMDVLRYIQTPQLTACPLGDCVKRTDIVALIKDIASELCIDITLENQLRSDFTLNLSGNAFRNIFLALFDNSKKFHPEKTPTVEINLTQDEHRCYICCKDDGKHIPPESLTHIWQPYFQGEKNFTGEIRGTGLGLSGIAHALWSIGGRCCAYNREDKAGVVIELHIPFIKQ
jgi:CheY-like chemotaxis protein